MNPFITSIEIPGKPSCSAIGCRIWRLQPGQDGGGWWVPLQRPHSVYAADSMIEAHGKSLGVRK